MENRFDNIGAAITNSGESINLDLMDESRKRIYRETLERDDDAKRDLDDNMMGKSIYVFFQIRYTKIKTYRRYIYIRQLYNSKQCYESHLIIYMSYIFTL